MPLETLDQQMVPLNAIEVSVVTDVLEELAKAQAKHPTPMRSFHEGYAVILEEVDELWDEIKKNKPCGPCVRKEVIQVAAMALRFLIDTKPSKGTEFSEDVKRAAIKFGVKVDDLQSAMTLAAETGQVVAIPKDNGGKHHVMPVDTARYQVHSEEPYGTSPALAPGGDLDQVKGYNAQRQNETAAELLRIKDLPRD